MSKLKEQQISLSKMEEEYLPDYLFDDESMYKLKEVIFELDDLDKAIILVYADEGSMSKTAKKFCVSPATIYAHIQRIRNIIKEKI